MRVWRMQLTAYEHWRLHLSIQPRIINSGGARPVSYWELITLQYALQLGFRHLIFRMAKGSLVLNQNFGKCLREIFQR